MNKKFREILAPMIRTPVDNLPPITLFLGRHRLKIVLDYMITPEAVGKNELHLPVEEWLDYTFVGYHLQGAVSPDWKMWPNDVGPNGRFYPKPPTRVQIGEKMYRVRTVRHSDINLLDQECSWWADVEGGMLDCRRSHWPWDLNQFYKALLGVQDFMTFTTDLKGWKV